MGPLSGLGQQKRFFNPRYEMTISPTIQVYRLLRKYILPECHKKVQQKIKTYSNPGILESNPRIPKNGNPTPESVTVP